MLISASCQFRKYEFKIYYTKIKVVCITFFFVWRVIYSGLELWKKIKKMVMKYNMKELCCQCILRIYMRCMENFTSGSEAKIINITIGESQSIMTSGLHFAYM